MTAIAAQGIAPETESRARQSLGVSEAAIYRMVADPRFLARMFPRALSDDLLVFGRKAKLLRKPHV